jgi:hypothetical protein
MKRKFINTIFVVIVLEILICCKQNNNFKSEIKNDILKDIDFESNNNYFVEKIDIDGDLILDKIISNKKYQGDDLYIFLGTKKGQFEFYIKTTNFSEDGGNQISKIEKSKSGFVIITNFPDRGYFEKKYFINYVENKLILKNIIYQTYSQKDFTKIHICNIEQNIDLGLNKFKFNLKDIPNEDERDSICDCKFEFERCLNDFKKRLKKNDLNIINDIKRYEALIQYNDLNNTNLKEYNDIAYFLEQLQLYKESIFLLEKIIKYSPTRVVAYLNIADSYWGNNQEAEAKKHYKKYLELMKSQNKDLNKILKRVNERIK